jgi:Domain of unknown function (DUF3597)
VDFESNQSSCGPRLLENDRSFDQLRRHCRREEEHRTGGESRQENNCGDRERALRLEHIGNTDDTAAMNVWLHKRIMGALAANGGKVPADIETSSR